MYVLFSGVPAAHRGRVEYGVALFLRTLYAIPLKWEIHPDDSVNWGEAWVSVQPPGCPYSFVYHAQNGIDGFCSSRVNP